MFIDPEIRETSGHDSSWSSAFHEGVFRKVLDAEVAAEEVFVEVELSVDGRRGRVEHGEDGVGEDCL